MEKKMLYDNLIKIIKEKIPQRGELTNQLVDMLFIEKEAVYRRLRGEVPFTFSEVVTIAKELNISLDNLLGSNSRKSHPFLLQMTDLINPTELDFSNYDKFMSQLDQAIEDTHSEIAFVSSILPLYLIAGYKHIYKFYLLKWAYQFGRPGSIKCYSDIAVSERQQMFNENYFEKIRKVNYTYFICDELLFYYLVNDIKYFTNIQLITEEDSKLLKKEMLMCISDLEKMAERGTFESGKPVHIYVSNLHFESVYTYFESTNYKLTLMKIFTLNEIYSTEEEVFNKAKTWIQALKRTSTMISESGEMQRLAFFNKQREFVEMI